jgi:cysteine sulfinate desulfinase/cysteine desulfurase-like protein
MGFEPERARGLLRVTLGRFNTKTEVTRFLEILPQALSAMQSAESQAAPAFSGAGPFPQ